MPGAKDFERLLTAFDWRGRKIPPFQPRPNRVAADERPKKATRQSVASDKVRVLVLSFGLKAL